MTEFPPASPTYVWDASALVAALRADRLDVLGSLVPAARNVTTTVVDNEIKHLGLGSLKTAGWLEVLSMDELDEFDAILKWSSLVGAQQGYNRGEATVFAWAQIHVAAAIVDDAGARKVASASGFAVHGTLWIFTEAIRAGLEKPSGLTGLIDALINLGEARYPFASGADFEAWAYRQGLLP